MSKKGLLIVISGPSGSGKDAVIEKLLEMDNNIVQSISATTRLPRVGEIEGKDYFFISEKDFCKAIAENKLMEYTKYCENYYGTFESFVENSIENGKDVILKIEVDGAEQIKIKCNESIRIFILPPSMEVLKKRLYNRGTETAESLKKRLDRALNEINSSFKYDYIVVNDDMEKCAKNIYSIVSAEKLKTERMKNVIEEVQNNAKSIN